MSLVSVCMGCVVRCQECTFSNDGVTDERWVKRESWSWNAMPCRNAGLSYAKGTGQCQNAGLGDDVMDVIVMGKRINC